MSHLISDEQHLTLYRLQRSLRLASCLASHVNSYDAIEEEDLSCFFSLVEIEIGRVLDAAVSVSDNDAKALMGGRP